MVNLKPLTPHILPSYRLSTKSTWNSISQREICRAPLYDTSRSANSIVSIRGARFPACKFGGSWGNLPARCEVYREYSALARVIRLMAAAMRPIAVSTAAACCGEADEGGRGWADEQRDVLDDRGQVYDGWFQPAGAQQHREGTTQSGHQARQRRRSGPCCWLWLERTHTHTHTHTHTFNGPLSGTTGTSKVQEAQLSPRDRATRRVSWNRAKCRGRGEKRRDGKDVKDGNWKGGEEGGKERKGKKWWGNGREGSTWIFVQRPPSSWLRHWQAQSKSYMYSGVLGPFRLHRRDRQMHTKYVRRV